MVLIPVLHHQFHLDCLQAATDLSDLDVWVKIDSGMGRLGFGLDQAHSIISFLASLNTLGSLRLMTHLANADSLDSAFTDHQLGAIRSLELDDYEWGIANSAGILGWPDAHNLWVRAGIALYGADPMSDRKVSRRELQAGNDDEIKSARSEPASPGRSDRLWQYLIPAMTI